MRIPQAPILIISLFFAANSLAQVKLEGDIFLTFVATGTYKNKVTGERESWPKIQTYADVALPSTSSRPLRTENPFGAFQGETTKTELSYVNLLSKTVVVFGALSVGGHHNLYTTEKIYLEFPEEEQAQKLYQVLTSSGAHYELLSTTAIGWGKPYVESAYIYNHSTEQMMSLMDFVNQDLQVVQSKEQIREDLETDIEYLGGWISRLEQRLLQMR